jgi:hypothetical protein
MNASPLTPYVAALNEALDRALDGLTTSHAVLLRHQVEAEAPESHESALLCLLAADALGASLEAAAPAAVALAALGSMGRAFIDLDASEAALGRWGMPRSLNAGDGFYALAHQALMHADGAAPELRLAAAELLDRTCRVYSDELRAAFEEQSTVAPAVSLSAAALGLGALYAGESAETVAALSAGDLSASGIPSAAREKLVAATNHLAQRA